MYNEVCFAYFMLGGVWVHAPFPQRPSEITFGAFLSKFTKPMKGPHYVLHECKEYRDARHKLVNLPSSLMRVTIQQPGSYSPPSQLKHSSAGIIWMWRASFSNSSLSLLA